MFKLAYLAAVVLQRVQWRLGEMTSSRPANCLRIALQVPRDVLVAIFNLTIAN